jgi:Ser/Thr protein kinase RdoA (MazF antagonist)
MNSYCVAMLTFEEGLSDEITQKTKEGLLPVYRRIVMARDEVEAEDKYLKHVLESRVEVPTHYVIAVDNNTGQHEDKDGYVLNTIY